MINQREHAILSDPAWLAHRYIAPGDRVRFRNVPREVHADAAFLTDEYLGGEGAYHDFSRIRAVEHAQAGRLHFIFHSAFCASTLLVRALDRPGLAMGLSEPVILNDIVGMRRRRELYDRRVGELLDGALKLLARPWADGEAVVVKPSNIINPLAPGLLALRPESKALLLYTPLPLFIGSVARKGMWGRLWVRELLEGLLRDGIVDLGFDAQALFRQTDLQCAAVGWLAQHQLFHGMVAKFGAERVRTLDSEALLSRPAEALSALAVHYGLEISAEEARSIAGGHAFARHSKSGAPFSMVDRKAEQAEAASAHADEIAKVTEWIVKVAETAAVDLDLPAGLLDP